MNHVLYIDVANADHGAEFMRSLFFKQRWRYQLNFDFFSRICRTTETQGSISIIVKVTRLQKCISLGHNYFRHILTFIALEKRRLLKAGISD